WEKVLWKKQPYPDNYVPDSFLSALQTNSAYIHSFRPLSTATLIHFSLPISIHFNLVMTFIGTYIHLLNGSLSSLTLCVFSTSTSVLGWSLCTARRSKRGPVAQQVGRLLSLLLLALVLFALSPVLRTLTEATTSDSIWALSAALFCLNMATADYSTTHLATRSDEGRGKQVKVSLNAAVCASVVLASRLRWNGDVFALLLFSMQVFALVPIFRARMIGIFTIATQRDAGGGARSAVAIHIGMIAFVSIVCPMWMRHLQRHKRRLHGPWDPAV
ncbi:phosphatidylinositol N-acetylglucosaminyltransferase, partial [Tilletiaria anomala UBC 951]